MQTSNLLVIAGWSESEQHSNKEHNDDTEINDFSLGFINDNDGPNENFIEDGNIDDYSSSPSFEVIVFIWRKKWKFGMSQIMRLIGLLVSKVMRKN